MSSFTFTFNSDTKPLTGRVFAKKGKAQKEKNKALDNKNTFLKTKVKKNIEKGISVPGKHVNKAKIVQNINNAQQSITKNLSGNSKPKNTSVTAKGFSRTDHTLEASKTFEDAPKLVKRKQKKDKIAAKAAGQDSENSGNQNINKSTQGLSHSLFSVAHKDIYVNTQVKGKSVIEKVFSAGKKFSDLDIHKYLVSNLEKINFTTLTNVQEKSIPVVLSGSNVLIRSQTGSGKTLAYAVPILNALQGLSPRLQRSDGVQAIVVVPTRELALQTHELFGKINTFQWIVVGHLCGGENRNTEKTRLRKGVHILIGTPGRLLDHMLHTTALKTHLVRCLVLDEADRLLDMGFKKDIVKIVEELDNSKVNCEYDPMAILRGNQSDVDLNQEKSEEAPPLTDPNSKSRQTILLSATLTKGIAELANFTMKDHVYVDALDESTTVNPEHMVIPNTVDQKFIVTHVKHRLFTLSAMLVAKAKQCSKMFVFMATSQMVDYHWELFTRFLVRMPRNRGKLKSGHVIVLEGMIEDSDEEEEVVLDVQLFKLHGSMDQSKRKEVFTEFRAAKRGILLCTDVVARGIDVPAADCIIQYTGPQSDEDYIHRVGRTGRAGKSGSSYIFLTHEEQDFITRLQEHKVFLKKHDPEDFLKHLSVLMEEPEMEKAATALQRRYENALQNDKDLHRRACLAYASWSRFYNTYSSKMRTIFDFKKVNLGHYVTSFGLNETPTTVARVARGQVAKTDKPRLNRKLAIHTDDEPHRPAQKRKIKSVSLTTSEFSSGLKPAKKKNKNKDNDN